MRRVPRPVATRTARAVVLLASVCAVALFASAASARAEWNYERSCGFVSIPGVVAGLELVVRADSHPPGCRRARRIVRAVPKRLPARRWRMVEGWKCSWSRLGGVYCRRHDGAGIAAYPGGD
jgi:hypothetical protein